MSLISEMRNLREAFNEALRRRVSLRVAGREGPE